MWRKSLWLACALLGCASPKVASAPPASADRGHASAVWFNGPVEKAFETAKAQKKPIFLYWGAVWCPPCNQVKAEVFSAPEFPDLMKLVVPVYLDGDSEGAQAWAEKLSVSGYPTLLLLGPDGWELLRISEALNFEEFSAAFLSAMTAGAPLDALMKRALLGMASDADWKALAYARADSRSPVGPAMWLEVFDAAPESAVVVRALLATKVLEEIAEGDKQNDLLTVQGKMNALFDAIFFSDATVFAARSTLVYYSREVVTTLFPNGASEQRSKVIERWLKAAEWLETNPKAGISTRLHAAVPQYELWRVENPEKPLPGELVTKVKAAVATADKEAKSSYERHAVVSDGAEMLADVGDVDGARTMLVNELKTTDTPWYYQATLAGIELKAGRQTEALDWSAKARESAKGNATRLQWIILDFKMTAKSSVPDRDERLARILVEFYDVAFKVSDGFQGRNQQRAGAVEKLLVQLDWQKVPALSKVIRRARQTCFAASAITTGGADGEWKSQYSTSFEGAGPESKCKRPGLVNPVSTSEEAMKAEPPPCVEHFVRIGAPDVNGRRPKD